MPSPVEAVTHPDPYPYYATLVAQRPFHFDETLRTWVACDAAAVTAMLASPDCHVRPAAEPVPAGILGSAAGDIFGDLVRMTDGDFQRRLKRVVVDALARVDPETVAALTAERTRRGLKNSAAPLDHLMFGVPAQVVATLCGLDDGADEEATRLIGEFVQCLPASASAAQQAAAARAAAALQQLMGPLLTEDAPGLLGELVRAARRADWPTTAPLLANGIGFLSQTYDATAGLIGNTLRALAREAQAHPDFPADLERFVREVARHDSPVHNTRRFATVPLRYGDAEVQQGQSILVLLAAANRDPAVNPDPHTFRADREAPVLFTFGAAAHGCPGETLAVTIAAVALKEWITAGFDPAELPADVTYRSSANVRVPLFSTTTGNGGGSTHEA